MNKQRTAWVMCVILLIGCFAAICPASAATVSTGTVHVDDTLRVRSGAGTSYDIVGYLKEGDVVTIDNTVLAPDGGKWYHIKKDSIVGYASADYITVDATYQSDAEFEAYLTAQGFPESYKASLRTIRAKHPNWVFRAQLLTMTWEAALNGESTIGKNNIQNPEAWRSMEYGAYNWTSKTYVSFDTGGWYSATRDVIAYYMDPRNWLDDTYIFQFEELSYSTLQTEAGVKAILPDKIDYISADLLAAAKANKISAYYMASKIVQEGTVTNGLALGTVSGYEGYYNFFDMGAYAHDGMTAVEAGALHAKNNGWDTPAKCLNAAAKNLAQSYIAKGQNTLYYQKFNVVNTASLYSHQYMTSVYGASSEGNILHRGATNEVLSSNLEFVIPVYRSMPDKVAAMPSKTGNNNNFLDGLTVSGCTLTPTFDRYTMNYAAQVEGTVSSVTITAPLSNTAATITGNGTVSLNPGENIIKLTVKATSGATRVYTVTITRNGGTASKPTIQGKTYTVDKTVTKVEPGTDVTTFLKNLNVVNGDGKVYTAAGKAKTSGIIGTGDIVRLYSGNTLVESYPIVIRGDVNGDGKVSPLDLTMMQKHILKIKSITGYYLTAADCSKDGKLSALDLTVAQKYILGITKTVQ